MTLRLDAPILFAEPRRLTPYSTWQQHIPFAMWLTGLARPNLLVELGTHYGDSYCAFCQAVETLGLETRCFAVDTWEGDPHAGEIQEGVLEDLRAHHDPLYGGFSSLLRSTFDEALGSFDDGSVDLLHIDGFHTYEAVSHDFETWLPKVSRQGLVLFHDIVERDRNFGVWRLWQDVRSKYPTVEFSHGYGLGVAAVGSELPGETAQIFEVSQSELAYLRRVASTLGSRLWTRVQRDSLHEAVLKRDRRIDELERERDRRIGELQRELDVVRERFERERQENLVRSRSERRELEQRYEQELTDLERVLEDEQKQEEALRAQVEANGNALAQLRGSKVFRYTEQPRMVYARYLALRSGNGQGPGRPFDLGGQRARHHARAVWSRLPEPYRRRLRPAVARINRALETPAPVPDLPRATPYESWLEVNELNDRRNRLLLQALDRVEQLPLVSVVMPVFDPPLDYLDRAIGSVRDQLYNNWELCIADDACTKVEVTAMLARWAAADERVSVVTRTTNGHISLATNSAAELASGEWLVFLDHDDELSPDALAELVLHVAEHPDHDVVYSDDDQVDKAGRRQGPQFKAGWSPELLLSYMYMGHLLAVRRSLFEAVGGTRVGLEGSQDYDLVLRATESSPSVGHIPRVLYHWRVLPGSTASSGDAKPYSLEAGQRAVTEALGRRGIEGKVVRPKWAERSRLGLYSISFPDHGPRVAVLIPTRDRVDLLRPCVESVVAKTAYTNYEVVIIDNGSKDPATLRYMDQCGHRVLRIPQDRFNFAALNNEAAEQVDCEYLLFLNNDTRVLSREWLNQMSGFGRISGVGAVGARLLFPDRTVQHAGVVGGLYDGMAGPAFKLLSADDPGYLGYAYVSRDCAAVTAACMLTPRQLFLDVGGFDEENFGVAYNDVDYCYRLREKGLRVVYCAEAELVHSEGSSRGFLDKPAEAAAFRSRWGLNSDPYYNPNLAFANERYPVSSRTSAPAPVPTVRAIMCAFTLNWEGAPYSQYEMTVRLADMGVLDPIVYCPSDGPLRSLYEASGVEVHVFDPPTSGVSDLAGYERGRDRLAQWMRECGAEVVYGNTVQTFYGIDAATSAGLPSIWNPRESENWRTYFKFLPPDVAHRALSCFQWPYQVVFVADTTRRAWSELETRHNFMTIHNGLDRARFEEKLMDRRRARASLDLPNDEVVILLLGTVCDRKGQMDLVEAVERLSPEVIGQSRFLLVGDRPSAYSDKLHDAIEHLPYDSRRRVGVVPETSSVGIYYSAADIFVCSSRLESYPRVILEAMAAGLPIVTTPVFGITEQVKEGLNAVLYEPGDTHRLADLIAELVTDSQVRSEMGSNSLAVLATLNDYERMVDQYARVFREAWLSGRPRAVVSAERFSLRTA